MDLPPQASNIAKGLADAARGTALGLRVDVLDGAQPGSADQISWAELTEYTLTVLASLQQSVVALAGYVDLLAARIRELEET